MTYSQKHFCYSFSHVARRILQRVKEVLQVSEKLPEHCCTTESNSLVYFFFGFEFFFLLCIPFWFILFFFFFGFENTLALFLSKKKILGLSPCLR